MNESRKAFEKACRDGLVNGGLATFDNGVYASELTRAVFSGWQANRAAIEIKLPEIITGDNGDGEPWRWMYASEVEDALRAAGIKVKE